MGGMLSQGQDVRDHKGKAWAEGQRVELADAFCWHCTAVKGCASQSSSASAAGEKCGSTIQNKHENMEL